mmetsp:Transcript_110245/g.312746  ORF Transcript_110245/g.312746 Transcript_110245/m.312746 type:complete len:383 (-) Transcript_110245:3-1151(-)
MGDLAPESLCNGAKDLGKRRPHRLRRVDGQRREQRQDVLLELVAGERVRQEKALLDDAHGLFSHLLLGVFDQLLEGLHQVCGRDLRTEGRAQLAEVRRYRQPHAPRAVAGRLLDGRHGVLRVLLRVEHLGDHQGGVDGRHADRVLRVLLGQLLVHAHHVVEHDPLVTGGDQVGHPVGRGAPHHGRVVRAQGVVRLLERGPLLLGGVAVDGRQQRAGGHARGEEVALRRQPVDRGHHVLRHEMRFSLHDLAQGLDGLLPDHSLLLRGQVLQGTDQQLVAAADVVGEDCVLPGHAVEKLLVVAERLLLDHLSHVGEELVDGLVGAERGGDQVDPVDRCHSDHRALVLDLLLEELQVVEVAHPSHSAGARRPGCTQLQPACAGLA